MKRDNARLFRCQFQFEPPEPVLKCSVEPFSVTLVLKRTHKIVGVSDQARLTATVSLDHSMKPQIENIVQVHVGQNR